MFGNTLRSLARDDMATLTIVNSAGPRGTNITFRHSQSGRVHNEQRHQLTRHTQRNDFALSEKPRVRECNLCACAVKSGQLVEGATRSTTSHVASHLTRMQIFCADGLTCGRSLFSEPPIQIDCGTMPHQLDAIAENICATSPGVPSLPHTKKKHEQITRHSLYRNANSPHQVVLLRSLQAHEHLLINS